MKVANALGATWEAASSSARALCTCWFEVRLGRETGGGELTARRIMVTKTWDPWSISRLSAALSSRLEGARVARDYTSGWQGTTTDKNGSTKSPACMRAPIPSWRGQEGFQTETRTLSITGAARVDFALGPPLTLSQWFEHASASPLRGRWSSQMKSITVLVGVLVVVSACDGEGRDVSERARLRHIRCRGGWRKLWKTERSS